MDQTTSLNIGVFDSGVGGLSVLSALKHKLPQADIYYYCDNKNFPYGPKKEDDVVKFVMDSMHTWQEHHRFDAVIIACNTASTIALPKLREYYEIPIIGVVPAIKPAAMLSKTGGIGLLATPGTISRSYTQELIDQFASNVKVIKLGNSRLVEIAEEKLRGASVNHDELVGILAPFFSDNNINIDHIVLGCTHFPLLINELSAACPKPIAFIDSSLAIANRTWSVVHHTAETMEARGQGYCEFRFSADLPSVHSLIPYLKDFGFKSVAF